jgi:hypothetical protein
MKATNQAPKLRVGAGILHPDAGSVSEFAIQDLETLIQILVGGNLNLVAADVIPCYTSKAELIIQIRLELETYWNQFADQKRCFEPSKTAIRNAGLILEQERATQEFQERITSRQDHKNWWKTGQGEA